MAEFLRDLVIKFGGPWPIIGGAVIMAAIAGWLAYKQYESNDLGNMWFCIALASGFLLLAGSAYPQAVQACKVLWKENPSSYASRNCEPVARCFATRLLDPCS